jgi:hypothetical protein
MRKREVLLIYAQEGDITAASLLHRGQTSTEVTVERGGDGGGGGGLDRAYGETLMDFVCIQQTMNRMGGWGGVLPSPGHSSEPFGAVSIQASALHDKLHYIYINF